MRRVGDGVSGGLFGPEVMARVKAVREWEAQHPVIAEAWNAAIRLDREWIPAEERRRAERDSALGRLARNEVPERIRVMLVDGPVSETSAVRAVRDWIAGKQTFLVLAGGTGAGKTLAACLSLMGRPGVFERAVSAGRLGLYGEDDVARMRMLRRAKTLVLDDLGAEFAGDVWRAQFDELIDERYGDRLRTVITTNLSPAALKERYGARVADRIRHDGQVVACGSESLRAPGRGS